MTGQKQANNENGAVLNRDFTRRCRSIIIGAEDLQKQLNDEGKEILEKFTECTNEMYGIAER